MKCVDGKPSQVTTLYVINTSTWQELYFAALSIVSGSPQT